MAQHLGDRSTQPVLRYETDDPNPPPMRVDVLNQYSDGVWRPTSGQLFDTGVELPATDASEAIARRTPTTRVTDNRMAAPQLPLPGTPLTIDVAADRLRVDANGMVKRVGEMDSYAVNYELVEPSQAQLRAADPRGSDRADDLAIDAMSADYVSAILDEVAPADLDAAEQAWRIQAWLRSARFTYSLDLATPVAFDDTGRAVPLDPLSQFLATRRGYCVQFATAMVMMARHRGIPARVAIGFRPARSTAGVDGAVGRRARLARALLPVDRMGALRTHPGTHGSGTRLDDRRRADHRAFGHDECAVNERDGRSKRQRRARAHHLRRAGAGRGDRRCRWMAARPGSP